MQVRSATRILQALLLLAACAGFAPREAGAQTVTATVSAGSKPVAVAANPVTSRIYVVNNGDSVTPGSVTVINAADNSVAATVAVGINPVAIAVNVATNKIYVANNGGSSVTVIHGADNSTAVVGVGTSPQAIAVNPVTGRIYVANSGADNSVSVIDGAGDTVAATVTVGNSPRAIAVNPGTDKIYVANYFAGTVTVIDGTSNVAGAPVTVGNTPDAVAVNPVTNRIYVANLDSDNVSVLEGTGDTVIATVAIPVVSGQAKPGGVAVNPLTNKIYVMNTGTSNVTVINGADNTAANVAAGTAPSGIAIDAAANRIYVANGFTASTVTVINGADNSTQTVAAGTDPSAVAVNPATGGIYVANRSSGNVTVIDGKATSTATITVGNFPIGVAVNPVTNKVYTANQTASSVTVVDGATNIPTTIALAANSNPWGIAVNPLTNFTYVANAGNQSSPSTVTVINGADNSTTSIAAGAGPRSIAVNPATNRIYAANYDGTSVTVINGADNTTASVPAGNSPFGIAVNPATNRIYVGSAQDSAITVINGADNTAVTVPAGNRPEIVAVNPLTNLVYIGNTPADPADLTYGTVTVVNGADNSLVTTVNTGQQIRAIAVNPVTNRIYVLGNQITVINGANNSTTAIPLIVADGSVNIAVDPLSNRIYVVYLGNNVDSGTVTAIDGATGTTLYTVTVGAPNKQPSAIALNPVTGTVYVSTLQTGVLTAIAPAASAVPPATAIAALPGNATSAPATTFNLTTSSSYLPLAPPVRGAYYRVDGGAWQAAGGSAPGFTAPGGALAAGEHLLEAFAVDGLASTSVNTGTGAGAIAGSVSRYYFVQAAPVPDAPAIGSATAGNAQASVAFTAPVNTGGSPIVSYTALSSPGGLSASGSASPIAVTGLTNGTAYTFTVRATNAAGGTGAASAPSNSVTPVAPFTVPGAPTIGTAAAGNGQASVTFTAPGSDGGSPITGYTVFASHGGISATGSASPITVTGLSNGSSYSFTVKAANAAGLGAASAASNFVTPQAPSTTALASSANPSTYGANVTFTATISGGPSPSGAVTFKDGSSSLGFNLLSASQATLSTNTLTVGSHSLTAVYAGGGDSAGSTSNTVTQTVNKGSSSVAVTSSVNPSRVGQSVMLTATITGGPSPTGTVQFKDGAANLGSAGDGVGGPGPAREQHSLGRPAFHHRRVQRRHEPERVDLRAVHPAGAHRARGF